VRLGQLLAHITDTAFEATCCHNVTTRDDKGVLRLGECPCALTREEVILNVSSATPLDPTATLSGLKVKPDAVQP